MNLRVNRRKFLQFAGGGAVGVAASGVTLQGLSTLNAALAAEEVQVPRGPEGWSLSVCSLCPAGCGLRVRMIGKRAVKIQGNPLHPVNRGGLCPRGLAGLQVLYHPDRLRAPQKNVGNRESPRWKEISWDEAIETVVQRLRELRNRNQAHTVALVSGHGGHLRQRLFERFLRSYGSPNSLRLPSGLDGAQAAAYLQQGVSEGVAYDLEGTHYLLSFGVNVLEGWGSPVSTMRAFGAWRDSAAGRVTKFVQVEPRLSVTAARADEWVALRPGTEAALALGIAYVLITEGLYDVRFVAERTFGFEDWHDAKGRAHTGFRSLVLSEYRLNDVAAITQIPVEIILRLGREFGRNRPALAIGGHQSSTLPGDLHASLAVHSLNALVGSLEVPGGALVRAELPGDAETGSRGRNHLPANLVHHDKALLPWADLTRLPDAILSGKPYALQALLVHGADPVFTLPNGERFAQALKRVPFVVSFSPFLDETSAQADLILPDHTDLEKWQESASPPTFPFPLQSISPPVLEPVHHTRDTVDVLLALARTLGGEVASALPHATGEEFLRQQVAEIFAAQAGYTFTTSLEETWNRLSERSGWWVPTYSSANQLWEQMKQGGGWWEPTYYYGEWNRVLRTPSGRFEFYSQRLAQWVAQHPEVAKESGLEPGDDRLCLPHQTRLPDTPKEFPLLLVPVEILPLVGGHGAHLPYLQQIAGQHVFAHWDSWLEMNPQTATKLGLEDGDWVWVESPLGRAKVRLRFYEGARPDVVHMPLGYGRTQGSAWGRRGNNPLRMIPSDGQASAGLPRGTQTYVRVYKS
ncbi:MAG: molybdopterin-dependent oxidoreductase [Acidobacteria bacterium]|nr:molybdopterin-dependent oxidoreductase [Acidobacteriota bacterium]